MKKILAFLLVCLLVASFSIPVLAMGEEMTVKKAAVTVDGKIDEVWKQADRQKLTYVKNKVDMPDDSYAYVSALWNGNTIYFLFEITDDDPSFNSTVGDWKNDGIYLFIEELGTGGKPFTDGQFQFALIPKEDFSQFPRRGDANKMGAYEYAYEETGDGFVIEFSYTFLQTTLAAKAEIYADFQYNDCNDAKERTHNFGWSDVDDSAVNNADVWGTLILSADEIKAAAPTTTAAPTTAAPVTQAAPAASTPAVKTADAAVVIAAIAAITAAGAIVLKRKH